MTTIERKFKTQQKIEKLEKKQKMITNQILKLTEKKDSKKDSTEDQIQKLTEKLNSKDLPEKRKSQITARLQRIKNKQIQEITLDFDVLKIKEKPILNFEKIKELYVDANNMLFIYGTLRKLVLGKKRIEADQLIINAFQSIHKEFNMNKTTVMFDDTRVEEFSQEDFSLICAKPKYKIADDYLVDLSMNGNESMLFLTSDAELRDRLTKNGVCVFGPKRFLIMIAEKKGIHQNQVESWLKKFQ
jgi:rRNA-processing protein FCF1